MPRALRSLPLLLIALALVAATASAAPGTRFPRFPNLQPQQFQAQGNGVVTLDGGFSVIGWITPSRRAGIRLVDRAGDAELTVNGREISLGRRHQVRLPGVGGRYLVTGSRFSLEVRGAQGLEASGTGWARFQGRGRYSLAGGASGPWNGARILIGAQPDGGDDGDDDRVRALGNPGTPPAPVAEPVAAPIAATG